MAPRASRTQRIGSAAGKTACGCPARARAKDTEEPSVPVAERSNPTLPHGVAGGFNVNLPKAVNILPATADFAKGDEASSLPSAVETGRRVGSEAQATIRKRNRAASRLDQVSQTGISAPRERHLQPTSNSQRLKDKAKLNELSRDGLLQVRREGASTS